jgi:hypothetical protein
MQGQRLHPDMHPNSTATAMTVVDATLTAAPRRLSAPYYSAYLRALLGLQPSFNLFHLVAWTKYGQQ